MSISMIKEQTSHQIKILKELSSTYSMTVVAPLVIVKRKRLYKSVAKISPSSISYYQQQILINYAHWNEERFFANEITPLTIPLIFKLNGFKFAILYGFELHFDALFSKLTSKNIDCVLVPSIATFGSYDRWKTLISTRAFTNNCYILRANRIGEYKEKEHNWKFYGDSLLCSPNGELLSHLGNKEELMIVDMSHEDVVDARKAWGFRDALRKRIQS